MKINVPDAVFVQGHAHAAFGRWFQTYRDGDKPIIINVYALKAEPKMRRPVYLFSFKNKKRDTDKNKQNAGYF